MPTAASVTASLARLPRLGVGISAEPGSSGPGRPGIDALALRESHPGLVHFLEYGADLDRGIDDHARRWRAAGLPATYHFLDINLEESLDLDEDWLRRTGDAARSIGASWLCGDAGRWHHAARERGHQTLLPPVLTVDSAKETAASIARVVAIAGLPCLPENPPSHFYLGPLHVLDYFARVADEAGCGLLLDCAHLAIFQRLRGLPPLAGFDGFPLDRVVELHVAGGTVVDVDGLELVEDDHNPVPLDATWAIVDHVIPRAPNLKAIVFECEKNPAGDVVDGFVALNRRFPAVVASRP